MNATCRHCNQTLSLTGPPILGQTAEMKLAEFAEKVIAPHLQTQHPDAITGAMLMTSHLSVLTVICQVQTEDPAIVAVRMRLAASVNQATARVLTDDDMHSLIAAKATFKRAEVLTLLKQMRDWLQYRDMPQPAPPKGAAN
jgi:hypothetical protein